MFESKQAYYHRGGPRKRSIQMVRDMLIARGLLASYSPKLVLLANDHSHFQRMMMAACRLAGIKVAYIQHASVSSKFPRLSVDYALLDGRKSLEIYERCMSNTAPNSCINQEPKVILSGLKRPINVSGNGIGRGIGIATNNLDNLDKLEALSHDLLRLGHEVIFRRHPRQDKKEIENLAGRLSMHDNSIYISDPQEESVTDFLRNVSSVIAGDSGILLEAALAQRAPFYFKTDDTVEHDYYGFVADGIARTVDSAGEVSELIEQAWRPPSLPMRRLSSTWGTKWFGNEACLLAETLSMILKDIPLTNVYEIGEASPIATSVYELPTL
jgi:hypothetical protein